MKSKIALTIAIGLAAGFTSCQKDFLQMPLTSTTTIDSVFSTAIKARDAWVNAYIGCLNQGIPTQFVWNGNVQDAVSGSLTYGHPWQISRNIIIGGLTPTSTTEDLDGYNNNYLYIRRANIVRENIDRVPDMTADEKRVLKAEMLSLIAYRYTQMMIMYGGVPMVTRSLQSNEDLAIPRASVKEVLDSVVTWCDRAVVDLPSKWEPNWVGRMTKGAVLSIKAKAQLFAARPLFNSATPYLDFGANNNLISLGNADANRWNTAAASAEAVIAEATGDGGVSIINTNNPLEDYGTATSAPGNREIILAYKFVNTTGDAGGWNTLPMQAFYWPRGNGEHAVAKDFALTVTQLEYYRKADGTDQIWPVLGSSAPFSDYLARMNQMEPRFKADFMPYEMAAWNNPNDNAWNNVSVGLGYSNGAARSVKFYYKAGNRKWFEFPIFRLAFAYLAAAEAYNEMGQAARALEKLNVIHVRAGLPAITETNQAALRLIIQREWAVEMHKENWRLHEMKHWKIPNLGNGIIGGDIRGFGYNNNTSLRQTGNTNYSVRIIYKGFWSPKQYLNPFPQNEVNIGYLPQNPGY